MGEIGDPECEGGDLGLERPQLRVEGVDLLAEPARLRDGGRGILAPPPGLSDGLRGSVPARLQLVGLLEEAPPAAIGFTVFGERRGGSPRQQARLDPVGLFAQEPGIKHCPPARLRRGPGSRRGRRSRRR